MCSDSPTPKEPERLPFGGRSLTTQYQNTRKILEELGDLVDPRAYLADGRAFIFEAPLSQPLNVGSYASITTTDGRNYFRHIISREIVSRDDLEYGIRMDAKGGKVWLIDVHQSADLRGRAKVHRIAGYGTILSRIQDGTHTSATIGDSFSNATITQADSKTIGSYYDPPVAKRKTCLQIGSIIYSSKPLPSKIAAEGFDRHSLFCGQSGSGKSFALGIVLEQLLLATSMPIVILDPNSDFIRLRQTRRISDVNDTTQFPLTDKEYDRLVKKIAPIQTQIKVLRHDLFSESRTNPLVLYFSDLAVEDQATVLGLDPIEDREEFYAFREVVRQFEGNRYNIRALMQVLGENYDDHVRRLALRIDNLRINNLAVWNAAENNSIIDMLRERFRCIDVDLGSMASPTEKMVLTNAVLGYFWSQREERRPVLLVVDEAHYFCPPEASSELQERIIEQLVTLAGEGRKFGIYLMLVSQRPGKLHPNVISQCENLFLLRMNSQRDLGAITEAFSFIPKTFADVAGSFKQGEALIGGKIVSNPTFIRFGGRLLEEGGSDVGRSWIPS